MRYQIREAKSEDANAIDVLLEVLGYELNSTKIPDRLEAYREHDAHPFYIAQGYGSNCRRFLKHFTNAEQVSGGNGGELF